MHQGLIFSPVEDKFRRISPPGSHRQECRLMCSCVAMNIQQHIHCLSTYSDKIIPRNASARYLKYYLWNRCISLVIAAWLWSTMWIKSFQKILSHFGAVGWKLKELIISFSSGGLPEIDYSCLMDKAMLLLNIQSTFCQLIESLFKLNQINKIFRQILPTAVVCYQAVYLI